MARASRLLAAEVRTLLALHPRDPELLASVAALRRRAFTPPPPTELPSGGPAEVSRAFSARTSEDLAALAASIVASPDPATDPDRAAAALELFLRVPNEAARAVALCDRLEAQGQDVTRARFRLTADALATRHAGDPDALITALDAALTALPKAKGASSRDATATLEEARQRAAALALSVLSETQRLPYGAQWLVVTQDRSAVLNAELAFTRRPALASELGPIARWLATPAASTLVIDERDLARVQAVREAFELTASSLELPPLPALELPRSGFATRAARLAEAASQAPRADLIGTDLGDAAALLALGDRPAAARTTLALALAAPASEAASLEAAAHAVRLSDELNPAERGALIAHLADPRMHDELALRDPTLRAAATLLYRLRPEPLAKLRLAAASPAPVEATSAANSDAPPSDPHHPDSRLAAASDLLATGQDSAAANILAALLRKVEATVIDDTPPRLYAVVTGALEADEPPEELVRAARRALHDERRAPPLISALRASPTASFALHADLLELARDPSRKDLDRLNAMEAWLAIWRATETAPDPESVRSLRRDEPALPAAAATHLGLYAKPFTVLGRFLAGDASLGPDSEVAYTEGLLALSLGRA